MNNRFIPLLLCIFAIVGCYNGKFEVYKNKGSAFLKWEKAEARVSIYLSPKDYSWGTFFFFDMRRFRSPYQVRLELFSDINKYKKIAVKSALLTLDTGQEFNLLSDINKQELIFSSENNGYSVMHYFKPEIDIDFKSVAECNVKIYLIGDNDTMGTKEFLFEFKKELIKETELFPNYESV